MFHHHSPPARKEWIVALASLACLCGSANGQNFTMQVTNRDPLGLGSFIPSDKDLDLLGMTGKFKGAFATGLGLQSEYNSNMFLTESDEEDDLLTTFSPSLQYVSDPEGGAAVSLNAGYQPVMRAYAENSDLNGFDQTGDITLRYMGGKTSIDVFGTYLEASGTDRLTGDFVEGSVVTGGFRAGRQIAPRTSLSAGWTASMSDYGSSENVGAEIYSSYFGGLWNATERLSVGSTLRYSVSESDNTGTSDAWALLLETRYKVGERIWLSASIGPEYTMSSGNGEETSSLGLTGNISARYVIDERWSWMGSIQSASVPSPNQTNYLVNDTSITTELQRALLYGGVVGGLDFSFSDYEDVGTVTTSRGAEQNLSAFLGYRRNFCNDRVAFDSTVRYTFNEGQVDWSQFLLSIGLDVRF
jgi:hypothetical protein